MPDLITPAPAATVAKLRRSVGDTDTTAQLWSDTDLQDALQSNSYDGDAGQEWDVSGAVVDLLTEHLGTLRFQSDFSQDSMDFEVSQQAEATEKLVKFHQVRRRVRVASATRSDVA